MRSIVWEYVLTLGLWVKCCSRETAGLPPRCSSMRYKSSAVRRQLCEESPKCFYQWGSAAEDTVQRIESLRRTRTRVLREKLVRKVDTLACTHCAQTGETEIVLQEYSTGHRPRLVRQTALNAATAHGENESEAGVDRPPYLCFNRRRARGTQRRGGVRRFTCLVPVFSSGDSCFL